ncbi:putative quinol monooxygenase [Streptomyces luteogriseus]
MPNTERPIALYGFLRPRPERADEVRRILSSFVEPTRREPGNMQYHLHEHEDGRFFLYEVWRSQEDLDRHNATSPHCAPSFRVSRPSWRKPQKATSTPCSAHTLGQNRLRRTSTADPGSPKRVERGSKLHGRSKMPRRIGHCGREGLRTRRLEHDGTCDVSPRCRIRHHPTSGPTPGPIRSAPCPRTASSGPGRRR